MNRSNLTFNGNSFFSVNVDEEASKRKWQKSQTRRVIVHAVSVIVVCATVSLFFLHILGNVASTIGKFLLSVLGIAAVLGCLIVPTREKKISLLAIAIPVAAMTQLFT